MEESDRIEGEERILIEVTDYFFEEVLQGRLGIEDDIFTCGWVQKQKMILTMDKSKEHEQNLF